MNPLETLNQESVSAFVQRAQEGERAWAQLSLADRIAILDDIRINTGTHAQEWVTIASRIKGLPEDSPLVGEEWISGPWALATYVESLAATLRAIESGSDPLAHIDFRQAPGNRKAFTIFPLHGMEKLLLHGFSAEVWTLPGTSEKHVRESVGLAQQDPSTTHGVALVLGAGNITSIAPLDVLYELYAKNRSVVLKLNPVLGDLGPVLEKILAPLVDKKIVSITSGDAQVGGMMVLDPGIASVHITGSKNSYDSIVKSIHTSAQPEKPVTSELGGVSPVIIIPGDWSQADLKFQAEHVATQRLHNSGSNCIAAQVVVVSSDWKQKDEFLKQLQIAYNNMPTRPNWYPGGADRVASAVDAHSESEVTVSNSRVLINVESPSDSENASFQNEYFAPVLSIVELPGTGEAFLNTAVEFANERLQGTLGANLIASPQTLKQLGAHLETAISKLRYGCIGVNCWTGLGFLIGRATWGAFPPQPGEEVVSGQGVVHNALLVDNVERTVVYGPFRPLSRSLVNREWSISPKPPWFVSNRTASSTGRHLTDLAVTRNKLKLVPIFYSALRG